MEVWSGPLQESNAVQKTKTVSRFRGVNFRVMWLMDGSEDKWAAGFYVIEIFEALML